MNENIAIKLDLYTLACCELLNRLGDLRAATQIARSQPSYEDCLKLFDHELRIFFQLTSPDTRDQAAEKFAKGLYAVAGKFDRNERAAAIFNDVGAAICNKIPSWDYKLDLGRYHAQGRDLAHCFFAASPWPETQERLSRECSLKIEYGRADQSDPIGILAEPFGYDAAPAAYYSKELLTNKGSNFNQKVIEFRS